MEADEGEDEDALIEGDVNCEDPTTPLGHAMTHHVLTPEDPQNPQSLASELVDL